MCGIAGFFGNYEETPSVTPKLLQRMLDPIKHRGPDGQGMAVFKQAALGHVRLAIIDLAGGGQPMASPDGRFHLSYNGELYNYKQIRSGLVERGCLFCTNSDTEVVLQALAHHGVASAETFRGMFACAFWDEGTGEGLLLRDRYGIKPLFYTETNGRLYFGSEIKSLLPVLPMQPQMDLNALHMLMNFRYVPGQNSLFRNIFHLPPGHCLHWKDGRTKIWKWAGKYNRSEGEAPVAATRRLLSQAVEKQLVSDVPVGAYLSGGVDSGTLVALAARGGLSGSRFPTFTLQTGDSPHESKQAEETAQLLGVVNFQDAATADLSQMMPWLIWHLEVPKVNSVQAALVARLAAKHVKVALSGLGGDEIFLGYNVHRFLCHLERLDSGGGKLIGRLVGQCGHTIFSRLGLGFEELSRGGQVFKSLPDYTRSYGILRNLWDSPQARNRIYGPKMLAAELNNPFDYLRENWPAAEDPVSAAAQFELEHKMVNDLLLQEDRLSMAYGLEVRVPFLDEDLASFAMGLSRRDKMAGCKAKNMLRQAVSEWLPSQVLGRPKSGFQVPIHSFFNTELRPLCQRYLNRKRLQQDGLFNPDFVEQILAARPQKRLRWHYFILYLMIGVNIWLDLFQRGMPFKQYNEISTVS